MSRLAILSHIDSDFNLQPYDWSVPSYLLEIILDLMCLKMSILGLLKCRQISINTKGHTIRNKLHPLVNTLEFGPLTGWNRKWNTSTCQSRWFLLLHGSLNLNVSNFRCWCDWTGKWLISWIMKIKKLLKGFQSILFENPQHSRPVTLRYAKKCI